MLSQEILELYKKSRLMTYRAMFGRIREKSGSLSATEAYAVDVIYLLGSPTITQLAETPDYFVFVFDQSHGQAYDKRTLIGGTADEFRSFIESKTGKSVQQVH